MTNPQSADQELAAIRERDLEWLPLRWPTGDQEIVRESNDAGSDRRFLLRLAEYRV